MPRQAPSSETRPQPSLAQPARSGILIGALGLALAAEPPARSLEFPTHAVGVQLTVNNDNRFFGVWRNLSRRDGDDHGYTHGVTLAVDAPSSTQDRWTLRYATDLYTRRLGRERDPDDPRGTATLQHFTSHDQLTAAWSREPPRGGLLAGAGLGWERLDSDRPGSIAQAAGQQRWLHDLVNAINPLQASNPRYVPDGLGVRDGVLLTGHLGSRSTWSLAPGVALRLDLEVAARLSSLAHGSAADTSARVDLMLQRHPRAPGALVHLALQTRLHDAGARAWPRAGVQLGHRRVSVDLEVVWPLGTEWVLAVYDERRPTGRPDVWTAATLRVQVPTLGRQRDARSSRVSVERPPLSARPDTPPEASVRVRPRPSPDAGGRPDRSSIIAPRRRDLERGAALP